MPLFLRKSLRAGPLRFNLSKSGIGVSTGVPGLRVGLIGPRGHYVYMGRDGLYYRKTLGKGDHRSTVSPPPQDTQPAPRDLAHVSEPLLEDTTGATVLEMAATAPGELVSQLSASEKTATVWVLAAAGAAALTVACLIAVFPWGGLIAIPAAAGAWWIRQWDIARRAVVVFFDVNDEYAQRYEALIKGFESVQGSIRKFRVVAAGSTDADEKKHQAGADTIVKQVKVMTGITGPRHLTTNVTVPSLEDAQRATYFLPDRTLLREGSAFAEVGYDGLAFESQQVRWIEAEAVPSDSQQVDTTWKYVNKSGAPDRRFKDNRQLPVLLYSDLILTAPNGLKEVYRFSNPQTAAQFENALEVMRNQTGPTDNSTAR